ncbi:glycosyltransferase family 2 protein [Candidatus Roizmanbacteria bacterium]|nr:glycosyltransferase family 2 protein [Candidatus Roizmanbacteria bacterium]
MKKMPTISVVIATFNSGRTLDRCLKSISEQNYYQDKIELIVVDGGSKDQTLSIAKKYKASIIRVPKEKQNAEYNKGYGIQYTTGEFILCIDHDNILPHKDWLLKMLQPLLENDELVASEPLRYRYDASFTLLDRYFALFGVNDPVPYYLGKADRMDYIHDRYNLLGNSEEKRDYYLVTFDKNNPKNIPTLGANGFLIRKKFLVKAQIEPGKYFHIDINVDLVTLGFAKYAFIKDDIIHLSNSSVINFLKRRVQFVDQFYMHNFASRRYSVYYPEDKWKLIVFIFYAFTFIKPTFDSLRGWLKIKDTAWFIHPFMCLAVVFLYGLAIIKASFKKILVQ